MSLTDRFEHKPASSGSCHYVVNGEKEEQYSEGFASVLVELNQAAQSSGSDLEGNLFYHHHAKDFVHLPPNPSRIHKRRNYFQAVRFKKSLLEIGFNAGHSALLALSCNPHLSYFGVDIGRNKYTRRCADILNNAFPGRIELLIADSKDALPHLASHRPELQFDVFHVDGGHGVDTCRTDISNCIRLAKRSGGRAHLILDDTAHIPILDVYREFVAQGLLASESLGNHWEKSENLLAKIATEAAR